MARQELTPSRTPGLTPFGRDPFSTFRREMDRLFDDFFAPAEGRSFAPSRAAQAVLWPSIDVDEDEKAYTVTAELPGIDMKDVEVDLSEDALTLRGEKRSERKEEEGGRRYSERSYGRFERIIPLAADVEAGQVEATCENGVLKVILPKSAQAREKSRRIEIKGAGAGGGMEQQASGQASGQQGSGQESSAQQTAGQQTRAASPDEAGPGQAMPGAGSGL